MERFWNTIYYFVYRADYHATLGFYRYTGILWLYKRSFIKRRMERKWGIKDPMAFIMNFNGSPAFGLSAIIAGGVMYGWPCMLLVAAHMFYMMFYYHCYGKVPPENAFFSSMFISCAVTFPVTSRLLFHKNKYRRYFKEFEKKTHKWKTKWALISAGVIFFPCVVWILFAVMGV